MDAESLEGCRRAFAHSLEALELPGEARPVCAERKAHCKCEHCCSLRLTSDPPCSFPVAAYAFRLARLSAATPEVLALSLCYIDDVSKRRPSLLQKCRFHRTLLAALIIAEKVALDIPSRRPAWCWIGGIPAGELARLQFAFAELVDWRLVRNSTEIVVKGNAIGARVTSGLSHALSL